LLPSSAKIAGGVCTPETNGTTGAAKTINHANTQNNFIIPDLIFLPPLWGLKGNGGRVQKLKLENS
jgi:hypothetical protein